MTILEFRKHFDMTLTNKTDQPSSLHLLDENSATVLVSVAFKRASGLKHVFMRKIDELITGGLLNEIEDKKVNIKKDENEEARPLTMDHLGVCFIAIMVCLGLSCVVFVAECLCRPRPT